MCISASPASPTRKTWKPARAARCWAASRRCSRCPTPSRRPPTPRRSPTRSSARITACIATSRSMSAPRARTRTSSPSWSGCRAPAGVKVFMGSSTGSLLIEDDEGVRKVLKAIRRRAAFHSEDEYRLRERMHLRVEGDPRSHPVWRDATAALMCTQRLIALARETGKRVHVLHVTTERGDRVPRRAQGRRHRRGDAAASHAGRARLLRAARHAGAAQSAGARRRAPRRHLAGLAQGVIDSIGSDHSPHTREEKAQPYPQDPFRHDRRADAGSDHARPRQRRPALAVALRRSHQRRPGARCSASPARAASPPATTPI